MKKYFFLTFIILYTLSANAQQKNHYLKLYGGKMFFGTGDIAGYSVQVEGAKNVVKKAKPFLNKLLLGAELGFDQGIKMPVIINPTSEEFIRRTFHQASNTTLMFKATYYPAGGFLQGLHVAVGPVLGYTYQTFERQADRRPSGTGFFRSSILDYRNGWLFGYRVSPGYEVFFAKKLLAGARIDFASYTNGDINTGYGLKAGIRF